VTPWPGYRIDSGSVPVQSSQDVEGNGVIADATTATLMTRVLLPVTCRSHSNLSHSHTVCHLPEGPVWTGLISHDMKWLKQQIMRGLQTVTMPRFRMDLIPCVLAKYPRKTRESQIWPGFETDTIALLKQVGLWRSSIALVVDLVISWFP